MNSNRKILSILLVLISFALIMNCDPGIKEQPFLLGQGYGINSPSLFVNDIDEAVSHYKDNLGFSVRGNPSNGAFEGSVSSSISFGDMTVFEILSVSDTVEQSSIPSFINNYLASNEGIRLFSLASSSADSTSEWLSSKGFEMDSIKTYRTTTASDGWSRDTGEPNRKSLDFDSDAPPAHLPRFIERTNYDYAASSDQWRTYYSYTRSGRNHPNRAVGMSAIRIAVRDLQLANKEFQQMGFEVLEENEGMARYKLIRNQEIHLVAAGDNTELNEFLQNNGEGVFAVRFEVSDLDSTSRFFEGTLSEGTVNVEDDMITVSQDEAFGVQLEFVQEPEEQKEMAETLSLRGKLDSKAIAHAENIYSKYCSLCHGDNREGYKNDHAPSLRSKSLLGASKNNNFMRYTIQFGRSNTAMAGYLSTHGGPLEYIDIEVLLKWLYEQAEVDEAIEISREPVYGDIAKGANIYAESCATCHGEKGEGITAPALGNPMLLATATDHFLRYAIAEGRDGTPMIAFKDSLNDDELDAVTAFLRSRASGWDVPEPSDITVPTPEEYVLNPDNESPVFNLRDDTFVSAEQVSKALEEKKRMVILDARSEVAWRQMHIPGAAPVPYYEEPETFIHDIPNDDTQIVIYCACPHAASLRVFNTLKRNGFKNISIIDEGILVWAQMGLPVRNGK